MAIIIQNCPVASVILNSIQDAAVSIQWWGMTVPIVRISFWPLRCYKQACVEVYTALVASEHLSPSVEEGRKEWTVGSWRRASFNWFCGVTDKTDEWVRAYFLADGANVKLLLVFRFCFLWHSLLFLRVICVCLQQADIYYLWWLPGVWVFHLRPKSLYLRTS